MAQTNSTVDDMTKTTSTKNQRRVDSSSSSNSTTSGKAADVSRTPSNSSPDKRSEFRQRMGIKPDTGDTQTFHNILRRTLRRQTHYYHFVSTASHGMLWLQIAIGASVTAMGTTNSESARIAITVLGAINTVLAGLLTFLKSRNQPNRALQFRNGLRGVWDDLWMVDCEMAMHGAGTGTGSGTGNGNGADVDKRIQELWAKYKEVRAESEANYPDLWVSLNKLIKPHEDDQHPNTQVDEVDETGSGKDDVRNDVAATNGDKAREGREPLLPKTRP